MLHGGEAAASLARKGKLHFTFLSGYAKLCLKGGTKQISIIVRHQSRQGEWKMTEYNNIIETSEKDVLKSARKWESICKISNVILSLIYIPTGFVFGFLGLMFFSLGFSENIFSAICSFVSSATFLLTPIFCVIGIVLSVIFRKKKSLYASFLIQFLPFGTLGIAVFAFFFSLF